MSEAPTGSVTTSHADALGHVDTRSLPLDGTARRVQTFTYDAMGRVRVARDNGPAVAYPLPDGTTGTAEARTLETSTDYDGVGLPQTPIRGTLRR